MSEYVEFHGDQVFLVQMSPNIAQISIFTDFLKKKFLKFICLYIFLEKRAPSLLSEVARPMVSFITWGPMGLPWGPRAGPHAVPGWAPWSKGWRPREPRVGPGTRASWDPGWGGGCAR